MTLLFREVERRAWTDPAVAGVYGELFARVTQGAVNGLLDACRVQREDVLDVASGPGPVARAAVLRGARVTALDLSLPMLRSGRTGDVPVRSVRADAEGLPFREAAFDVVVSNLGLLHFPRPERAMQEAARVLRRGGRAGWSVWDGALEFSKAIPASLQELGLPTLELVGAPEYFRFQDEASWARSVSVTGLNPEPLGHVGWVARFASAEEFFRMYEHGTARTRATIGALPASDRDRLEREVGRRLARYGSEGGLEIPAGVFIGVATKS